MPNTLTFITSISTTLALGFIIKVMHMNMENNKEGILKTFSLVNIGLFFSFSFPLIMIVVHFITFKKVDKLFIGSIVYQLIGFIVNIAIYFYWKLKAISK